MARPFRRVRYEVIQRNWLIYYVDKVETVTYESQDPAVYRRTVRWFLHLDRAEACAQGLAEDRWTEEGPILAVYEPLIEENDDDGI